MSNMRNSRANAPWRTGIIAISVLAFPWLLVSQEIASSQSVRSGWDQPFTELDDSLTNAADALLASASQTTSPVIGKNANDSPPSTTIAILEGPRSRTSVNVHPGEAAIRLNLLRPAVDPILRTHGVPTYLAAIILVESAGRPDALSPKGARGLWQLMPNTARRYGLRVDEIRDDRLNLFRATDAAARYLHDLYLQFGDWKLALAAYNSGEVSVGTAILKAHTQNFDQLAGLRMLPLETRNYVPRVLAAAQFLSLPAFLEESPSAANTTTVYAFGSPADSP